MKTTYVLCAIVLLVSCAPDCGNRSFVGTWRSQNGDIQLRLAADGGYTWAQSSGEIEIANRWKAEMSGGYCMIALEGFPSTISSEARELVDKSIKRPERGFFLLAVEQGLDLQPELQVDEWLILTREKR